MTVSSIAVGPAADAELLAQHRQVGQGPRLRRRGREGGAADLRQGSEERVDAGVRREGDQAGREDAGVSRRRGPVARAAPAGPHRDGDQGHGARSARDRRRRSAAGVLADRARTHGGVRVGRQGSLGGRLGQVARLRAVLHGGRARARAPAAAGRSRSTSRRGRCTAARDRSRSRSRRGNRTAAIATCSTRRCRCGRAGPDGAGAPACRFGRSRPAATKRPWSPTRPSRVTISRRQVPMPQNSTAPPSRLVVPDPAAEYRFRPPDEALLKSIASATGGAWHPDGRGAGRCRGRQPHRAAARVAGADRDRAGLWFVDLLLRRVRVFEPSAG